jgi:hypothetical protein
VERQRRTKTLAWRVEDERNLRALRAAVAARLGVVWTERDVVAAALRLALDNLSALGPPRPTA